MYYIGDWIEVEKAGKMDNVEHLKRYGEEMDQFLDIQYEKGVRYDSPAEAYEDFKNYYDKRLKAAGQAGKRIVIDRDTFS